MGDVECPIDGCMYTGEPNSVQAHISASPGDGHGGKSGFQYQEQLAEQASERAEATNLEKPALDDRESQPVQVEPAEEPAAEAGEGDESMPTDQELERQRELVEEGDQAEPDDELDDDQEESEDDEGQLEIGDEETADWSAVDEDAPVPTHHHRSDEGPDKPDPEAVDVDGLAGDGDEVAEAEAELEEDGSAGIPIPVSSTTLIVVVAIVAIAALWMSTQGDAPEEEPAEEGFGDEISGEIKGLI